MTQASSPGLREPRERGFKAAGMAVKRDRLREHARDSESAAPRAKLNSPAGMVEEAAQKGCRSKRAALRLGGIAGAITTMVGSL